VKCAEPAGGAPADIIPKGRCSAAEAKEGSIQTHKKDQLGVVEAIGDILLATLGFRS